MPFLQLLNDVRRCGAFDHRFGAPIVHCSAGQISFLCPFNRLILLL